jgi:DNA mismatch repair protein MutS2
MTDARSQQVLEYPALRERLVGLTAFGPSRRLAAAHEPSADPVVVERLLDETDEARGLLSSRPDVGIGGAHDIGPHIGRARRGGRLDGGELLAILETLVVAGRISDSLRSERRPLLHALSRQVKPLPQLRARLETSVDNSGELLDSASPALGGLRRQVRIAYERLRSRLEQLVHRSELSAALQEPIITLRNGRYVVPVRADAKGRVKGIVHDQSGSGQTLFIEPLVAVELGNAWREAQLAAEAEEERILDELSALVGTNADALAETLDALATFDFWISRARLAGELNGVRAKTVDEPIVELLSARHPGLVGRVVPIDIRLGGDYRALVITGPNTGGKTVALRTLGLLSLMHQSGLHVPAAEGSRLPIFREVFADIGDEQSIAQSLSTFSGHLRSIVRIVEGAGPGTLVLLDELGAGTDPTEGSALAQALLDYFLQAGALVAATTHYAELKAYAHNTALARNASVEFDIDTLSPTYRLSIGLPGTSHAFAIAERLGLRAELVADARSRLSVAQQEFEATLASIKAAEATTSDALARASLAEQRAREARREAEEERAHARRERETALTQARREAEQALADVQTEIRAVRKLLAQEALTEPRLDEAVARLEQRLAPFAGDGAGTAAGEGPELVEPLAVGAWVRAPGGWQGRIVSLDEDTGRASVQTGELRLSVPLADLAVAAENRRPKRETDAFEPARSVVVRPAPRAIPTSLDVRGARVEEALTMLEGYLDQAAVNGAPRLTIVHGFGSGALRDALRAALTKHPLVKKWRPGERGEGGDGATIVEF